MEEIQEKIQLNLNNLVCLEKNPVQYFCFEDFCNSQASLCSNRTTCKCYENHKTCCFFVDAKKFLQTVADKKKPINEQIKKCFERLDELYQKTIEKMSEHRQYYNLWISNYGLTQIDLKFLSYIQRSQLQKINSKFLHEVKQNQKNSLNHTLQDELRQSWPIKKSQFFNSFRDIDNFFKQPMKNIQNMRRVAQSQLLDCPSLIESFFDKGVRQIRLFYNSKRDQGTMTQLERLTFNNMVGEKKNILILIKTEFNKVFGGFNPKGYPNNQQNRNDGRGRGDRRERRRYDYDWDGYFQEGQLINDYKNQSFIFSVDNRQKYPNIRGKNAISCGRNLPGFGLAFDQNDYNRRGGGIPEHDFRLLPDQNGGFNVKVSFPVSYNNGKYIKGLPAINAFSGGYDNNQIKVICWQAFEVFFIDEKQNQR